MMTTMNTEASRPSSSKWERKLGLNGRIYYYSLNSKTVQILPPKHHWLCKFGLPYGWEMAFDAEAKLYFINHIDQTVTYTDPRSDGESSCSGESSASESIARPRKVVIERDDILGFGFIAGSEKPVIIRSVTPDGPSEGKLLAGDQIVQIDWHHVTNVPREDVIQLIREQDKTLTLTVMQPNLSANSAFLKPGKKCIHPSDRPKVRFSDDVTINNQNKSPTSSTLLVRPGYLRIRLENHQLRSFAFDHETLAADAIASICTSYGFKDPNLFALVLTPPHSEKQDEVLRRTSSSVSSYSIKSDVISESLLIAPWDSLSKVVTNVAVRHHTCRFRMMYMAKDFHSLARNDPEAFKYLYVQCVNDVTDEDVYSEQLTEDEYMKLACIHMQEMFVRSQANGKNGTKFKFGNQPMKISLKHFEREYGLKTFLPASLLHKMQQEGRSVRKALQQYFKEQFVGPSSPMLSPSITDHQSALTLLRQQYLKVLAPQHLFGGRYFEAGMESMVDSNSILVIGHHYGVSEMINRKTKMVSVLASFRNISKVEVLSPAANSSNATLTVECYDAKVFKLFLDSLSAHNMALMTSGYCRVHGNADMELTLPTLESTTIPLYYGIHKIVASSWNYPTLTADKSAQREYFFCDFSEPITAAVLAQDIDVNDNLTFEVELDDNVVESDDEHEYEVAIGNMTNGHFHNTTAKQTNNIGIDAELHNLVQVIQNEILSEKEMQTEEFPSPPSDLEEEESTVMNGTVEYENILVNGNHSVNKSLDKKPKTILAREKRLSTFKPNAEAEMRVFSQTDERTLEKLSNMSSSLSESSSNIPKLQKSEGESEMSVENVTNHNELNGQPSTKVRSPSEETTEELIEYFQNKASESRNASNTSLDAIEADNFVPMVTTDLALGNKMFKNKHRSLKDRMSWAVGDRPSTLPVSSSVKQNCHYASNPDVRPNGVSKKHKHFGFLRLFRGKKHHRKSASLSNLPRDTQSQDDLRNFDLAENANFHRHKQGFFRRLFSSSKKSKRSKRNKGFSLRKFADKKKTYTGTLDITVSPSEERRSVDLLPTGKYAVKEYMFQEQFSENVTPRRTVDENPAWATDVVVHEANDVQEQMLTSPQADIATSSPSIKHNVKMRSSSPNSSGESLPQSFLTFQHSEENGSFTEQSNVALNKIIKNYDVEVVDKKIVAEENIGVFDEDDISTSIAIKRKPYNRPPQKPARQTKKLLPATSPVVPVDPLPFHYEPAGDVLPKVDENVEDVEDVQKQAEMQNEAERETHKEEVRKNNISNVKRISDELAREAATVRRKSTKRKAPSPPVHIPPFILEVKAETHNHEDSVAQKEEVKNCRPEENEYENIEETNVNLRRPVSTVSFPDSESGFEDKRNSLLTEIFTYLDNKEEVRKEKGKITKDESKKEGNSDDPLLPYGEGYEMPGLKKDEVEDNKNEYENDQQSNLLMQVLMKDFKEDLCSLTLQNEEESSSGVSEQTSSDEHYLEYNSSAEEYEVVDAVCKTKLNLKLTNGEESLHGRHVHSPIKQAPPPSVSFVTYHNLITPIRFSKTSNNSNSFKPSNLIHASHLQMRSLPKPPVPPKPTVTNN